MMNSAGRSTNRFIVMRERATWKAAVYAAARSVRLPVRPLPVARITLVRHSSVQPDPDNLVAGFKACLDGLVTAGVLENDRWANIGMPTYDWKACRHGEGHVTIEVNEV